MSTVGCVGGAAGQATGIKARIHEPELQLAAPTTGRGPGSPDEHCDQHIRTNIFAGWTRQPSSRRHARERASLRPSWRMRPERHSRLCLHTSPVRNPPRYAHLTGSSVQPALQWTCGCVLGLSREVNFSRTFANMAPRFETRPENAESAAFESSVQQPVVRKRPHPTSTSLSNSMLPSTVCFRSQASQPTCERSLGVTSM